MFQRFSRPFQARKQTGPRINHQIRTPQIRLIGSDGKQYGIFALDGALRMAQEEGLDLVEIDPNSKPPVCKVIDYGKYKYNLQKKQHESKRHQVVVHVKEIKLRPNTDEHDIQFKLNHVRRFIQDKDKAKITIQFRGREIQHQERAHETMKRIIKETEDIAVLDMPPKMEGRNLSMILMPK